MSSLVSKGHMARSTRVHHLHVQAVSEQRADNMMMKGQKTLEINPRHPLVEELKAKVRQLMSARPLHSSPRVHDPFTLGILERADSKGLICLHCPPAV